MCFWGQNYTEEHQRVSGFKFSVALLGSALLAQVWPDPGHSHVQQAMSALCPPSVVDGIPRQHCHRDHMAPSEEKHQEPILEWGWHQAQLARRQAVVDLLV